MIINVQSNTAKTFGDWAYLGIIKHYQHICASELAVLEDKNPEDLHQMRVGMRRLRSVLTVFAPALALPSLISGQNVKQFAQVLGNLRDLDIFAEILKAQFPEDLPTQEKAIFKTATKVLENRRKKALKQVKNLLSGTNYSNFKQAFTQWLEKPRFEEIAKVEIPLVLPDLLLPCLSQLLIHPGWWLETAADAEILHDLRKTAKRARYNLELFSSFYGENYQQLIERIKSLQTILGDLQDNMILSAFLDEIVTDSLPQQLPTIYQNLRQIRQEKWQSWQVLKQDFLQLETRQRFRYIILG